MAWLGELLDQFLDLGFLVLFGLVLDRPVEFPQSTDLVALLVKSHSVVVVERGIVRHLGGEVLENFDGAIALVFLDVDPADGVGHFGEIGELLFGAVLPSKSVLIDTGC